MAAGTSPPPPTSGDAASLPRGADLVLVDFDGTLAAADVGNRFFRRFTEDREAWSRLLERWRAEEITARECLARECELARTNRETALAFADEFELAPGAAELCGAARAAGAEVVVASDGLSFYIERLLERAELALPFTANELRFEASGLRPIYRSGGPAVPMSGSRVARAPADAPAGCGRCGNCKGASLRAARAAGRRTVLIGDGYSDRCAAREADVIYAKDDLLDWCRREGLPARPFRALAEVAEAEGWCAVHGEGTTDRPGRSETASGGRA